MSADYKKFTVVPKNGDERGFEVYSTSESYTNRKNEIDAWMKKLAESWGLKEDIVEVTDATWSEATIRNDRLFGGNFKECGCDTRSH